MLKFDIQKLRSVYVYILKVTNNYVYVTETRTGQPYKENSSVQDIYKGHAVSKIKIHYSVGFSYSNLYTAREFSEPRLASLNYYDDDIVSIEIQTFNKWVGGYQEAVNWQSFFSRTISDLTNYLERNNVHNAWINGTEIFWASTDKKSHNTFSLDACGILKIEAVEYVKLDSLGLSLFARTNNKKELFAQNNNNQEMLASIANKAILNVSKGKVLSFNPNANEQQKEQIIVYSPVLSAKKLEHAHTNKGNSLNEQDEEKKVFFLNSEANPAYANINFTIKAANTIGKLYGFEYTDPLDIQSVIKETGEVNLLNIDETSRKVMPTKMTALTSLAFIFKFINKETKLDNLRELSKMFRFCINKGLVFESKIKVHMKKDAPSNIIPLYKYNADKENIKIING